MLVIWFWLASRYDEDEPLNTEQQLHRAWWRVSVFKYLSREADRLFTPRTARLLSDAETDKRHSPLLKHRVAQTVFCIAYMLRRVVS